MWVAVLSTATLVPPAQCVADMDAYCRGPAMAKCAEVIHQKGGDTNLVALLDGSSQSATRLWRCYSPSTLDTNNTRYNPKSSYSALYCTEQQGLESALQSCLHPTKLVLLEDDARDHGAVCLDGTPPAIYVRTGDPNRWHVHLEGGGWCFHDPPALEEDNQCYYRAYSPVPIESRTPPRYLGSSAWTANYTKAPPRGFPYFLSASAAENPAMANWSFAWVHYCDGASFTGDATEPKIVNGQPLWYRGRRIRDAVVRHLRDKEGMGGASDVVVSGTSAGGLAVYLGLDAIAAQLPTVPRVRGLASAGFFLAGADGGGSNFTAQITALAVASNSSPALDAGCVRAAAAAGRAAETCFFPQNSVQHLRTPLFALQSRFDTWQLEHIAHASSGNPAAVEAYGRLIRKALQPVAEAAAAGGGAAVKHALWLSSCLTHGLAQTSHWVRAQINGEFEWSTFNLWFTGGMDDQNRSLVDCDTYKCDRTCP
jgi:hypothetical protein